MGTLSPVCAGCSRWPMTSSGVTTQHMGTGGRGHMGQCSCHIMSHVQCTRHVFVCSSWVVLVYVCPSDVIIVHCQLFDGEQNDDTSLIWAPQHWAATAQFLPEPHTPSPAHWDLQHCITAIKHKILQKFILIKGKIINQKLGWIFFKPP